MDWVSGLFNGVIPLFDRVPAIRALFGVVLVFFLPGFAWSFVFLKRIKIFERLVISIPLSLIIVTLSLIVVNKFGGMKISVVSSALVILGMTVLAIIIWYLNRMLRRKTDDTAEEG